MEVPKKIKPREINSQKREIFIPYRSNSQRHYKNITSFNYDHRIRLNPLGEKKTLDIRDQIPLSHIQDTFIKSEVCSPKNKYTKTAYEKAKIEETINTHTHKQKHQRLLKGEKKIRKICFEANMITKKKFENRKERLKNQLTRIIKDALKFSKKNSAVRAMLPDNINEIVSKAKKETQDLSMTLNFSRVSKISKVSSIGMYSILEKNDFLNSLGIDMENLNSNNINIDIDKCWNYIVKLAKGKNVEDILRYKVVNIIMNLVEKKSSEKARKIYEKLDIYKRYMALKKNEKQRRKKSEENKKEMNLKNNVKEYLKQKMIKSLSEKKNFKVENKNNLMSGKKYNFKKKKKIQRVESAENIIPESQKEFKRLNAYNDVTRIISFIDNSKKNSQSKVCRNHFANIQITKNMDRVGERLKKKNEIIQ